MSEIYSYDDMVKTADKNIKWDHRFIALAEHIAQWSKDPSTKVGCVLVNDRRVVVGMGYNGFPRGVEDTEERLNDRPTKYKLVVHAEVNAILNSNSEVAGSIAYNWPLPPCVDCMKFLIQSGVKGIVYPMPDQASRERWGDSWELANQIAKEAGLWLVEL